MAETRKRAKDKAPSFEAAMERLEEIVTELETGDLTLDDSLARYEEGLGAIRQCYTLLDTAEKRIEALIKGEDGELTIQPFAAGDNPPEKPSAEEGDK